MPTLDTVPCRDWHVVVEWILSRADHQLYVKALNHNNNVDVDELVWTLTDFFPLTCYQYNFCNKYMAGVVDPVRPYQTRYLQ
jgi:hypothetical protein